MNARDEAVETVRRICPAHLSADVYGRIIAEKFDAYRAAVLREAAAAVDSGNRFPEPVRSGAAWAGRMLRRMADEAPREELAAAVARVGALPVPLGHAEPAADFFQPDRTYRSSRCGDFRFRCLTVDAHPDTGDLRAFGWRYSATPNVWRPADLDANDWACCGWTETTEESAR